MGLFSRFSNRNSKHQSQIVDPASQKKLVAVKESTHTANAPVSSTKQPENVMKTSQPDGGKETPEDAKFDNPGKIQETADTSVITQPYSQSKSVDGTGTIAGSLAKSSLLSKTSNYNPLGNFKPPPRELDDHGDPATRQDVKQTFEQFAQLIHASTQPLPVQTGDGTYPQREETSGLLADITSLSLKDLDTVRRVMEQKVSGEPQDDRKYLMESVMQLAAALPDHSKKRVEVTGQFLDLLWNSLAHPPRSYLGDEYKYRSADGSRNNYTLPQLGAANTPYARSVNPRTTTPAAKPDPFLLFDSLLARQEFKPNPNRVSSVFFSWASLVIHDLFQTDHTDPTISKTSSYLDLSILYGDTQEDQNQMRTFKDGKIKPDCFAEERLLAFPPTAGVLLIMLNRWHNYVVEQLALINENGRFAKPTDDLSDDRKAAAWKKYDEDLFQTGRLITCGLYINITLYDYLRTIVNLNRTNTTWTLDPRMEVPNQTATGGTPRGTGNQVSAEFALSYRWHSCVGQLDEAWTEEVYRELFGKAPDQVDLKELMIGLTKWDYELPKDPFERPFAHLKRGADGKFNDDDLATIMINATEQVSGAFGARNTPKALRAITVLGIMQARSWNLCTLNEFRAFFGLKTYDTFEEINSDQYVADQLKHLYEHPDYVEMYPGIAIEEAKHPMIPGVGICPNHTIARAVLSDAVALVRGDRHYTVDHNPKNLTNWGFSESNYDLSINQGCVLYKLLLRGLPDHFNPDSIYVHYPMTVPDENAKIMKDLGRFYDYNWEKPAYIAPRINLTSYGNAKYLLERSKEYSVMWNIGLGYVLGHGGERFCLAGDTAFHHKQREIMQGLIYRENWHKHVKDFYLYITERLLAEKSVRIATVNQVDIIRDVSNLAHVHFGSNMFALPLKDEENPRGIFSENELWMAMSVIFTAVFFDFEPTKSFPIRKAAHKIATMMGKLIEVNIKSVVATSFASRWFDSKRESHNALADYGVHMIRQLSEGGMSTYDMAFSQILPTAIAMVPNQSQVFAQVLDFYLGEGASHWPAIQELAKVDTPETDDKLLHYVQEGIRLNGTFGSYRRAEVAHTFEEDGKKIDVKPGDKVFCSFVSAARDPSIFPEPNDVKVDRPLESYIHYGIGDHTCLGKKASQVALTAMLRVVGRIPGLRRAPGEQGQLKKVPREGGFYVYMTERQDSYFVFPTTMKVHYDGVIPAVPKAVVEH